MKKKLETVQEHPVKEVTLDLNDVLTSLNTDVPTRFPVNISTENLPAIHTTGTQSNFYNLGHIQENLILKKTKEREVKRNVVSSLIRVRERQVAPWAVQIPRIGTFERTQFEFQEYKRAEKYIKVVPSQFFFAPSPDDSEKGENFLVTTWLKARTLRSLGGGIRSTEEETEVRIFHEICSRKEGLNNLASLVKGLTQMVNETGCLPDLNYGLLSSENFVIDIEGNITLIDFGDQSHLPADLLQKVKEANTSILHPDGSLDELVLQWIKDNQQYGHAEVQKLEDWSQSIVRINTLINGYQKK